MKPLMLWIIILVIIFGVYIVHTTGMCGGYNCTAQSVTFGNGN